MRSGLLGLGLALGLLASGPAAAGSLGPDGWYVLDEPASDFVLKDLEGHTLRAEDLAGKVVFVDLWATWCGPCLRELPDLKILAAEWKGRDDVFFLSGSVTEDAGTVSAFARKNDVHYPIYLADDLLGPYEAVEFPTKLVIDARRGAPGRVRFRREGYTTLESIRARIDSLLAEGAR